MANANEYHKAIKKQIQADNTKLSWEEGCFLFDEGYRSSINNYIIFSISKTNFSLYAYHMITDTFLTRYGFKDDIITGNRIHMISLPGGIDRNIENFKIIIQELFDSFLLDYAIKSEKDKNMRFLFRWGLLK